jgi:hypothetical protein
MKTIMGEIGCLDRAAERSRCTHVDHCTGIRSRGERTKQRLRSKMIQSEERVIDSGLATSMKGRIYKIAANDDI